MATPRALVLRAPGTNCDEETAAAWTLAGAIAETRRLGEILERPDALDAYQILTFPGGFSYGDDLGAGRIFATQARPRPRRRPPPVPRPRRAAAGDLQRLPDPRQGRPPARLDLRREPDAQRLGPLRVALGPPPADAGRQPVPHRRRADRAARRPRRGPVRRGRSLGRPGRPPLRRRPGPADRDLPRQPQRLPRRRRRPLRRHRPDLRPDAPPRAARRPAAPPPLDPPRPEGRGGRPADLPQRRGGGPLTSASRSS